MHGWKVGGGLADCHRRRASQDAAVNERGVWGQRAGCGEAVAGLGRQGRGRLWLCLGGAVEGAFCSAWMRLKAAILAMFLTQFCLDIGVSVGLCMSCQGCSADQASICQSVMFVCKTCKNNTLASINDNVDHGGRCEIHSFL